MLITEFSYQELYSLLVWDYALYKHRELNLLCDNKLLFANQKNKNLQVDTISPFSTWKHSFLL